MSVALDYLRSKDTISQKGQMSYLAGEDHKDQLHEILNSAIRGCVVCAWGRKCHSSSRGALESS